MLSSTEKTPKAWSLTRSGFVMGSPGFMSPEQAEGLDAGPASDIFSLGAVLAFAATGEGPFGGGSTPALVYRVVHSPPSLERVPYQVRPLVERCLGGTAGCGLPPAAQKPAAPGLGSRGCRRYRGGGRCGRRLNSSSAPRTVVASASSASPASPPTSPAAQTTTNNEATTLAGTWTGTYTCSQGLTGLRLNIQVGSNNQLDATFNFYAVPSNPNVPTGSFAMIGSYTAQGVVLSPDHWINEPSGYEMVGLNGGFSSGNQNVLQGQVSDVTGCTTFLVQKS